MSYLSDTPSLILLTYLIEQGLFTLPSSGSTWPLYHSHLPDGRNVKDNAAGIFDTAPVLDGRHMEGEVIQHYGINIQIRNKDYETGWLKGKAILDDFDDVAKTTVTVGDNTYTVWSISARSGVVYEGVEQGTKRRYLFRTDWALTITEN